MVRRRRPMKYNICDDLIRNIFQHFLDLREILICACVSRQWNRLANEYLSTVSVESLTVRFQFFHCDIRLGTFGYLVEVRRVDRHDIVQLNIPSHPRCNLPDCTEAQWTEYMGKHLRRAYSVLLSLLFRMKSVEDVVISIQRPGVHDGEMLKDELNRLMPSTRKENGRLNIATLTCHAVETACLLNTVQPKQLIIYGHDKTDELVPWTLETAEKAALVEKILFEYNSGSIIVPYFLTSSIAQYMMAEIEEHQLGIDCIVKIIEDWQRGRGDIKQYMFCIRHKHDCDVDQREMYEQLLVRLEFCTVSDHELLDYLGRGKPCRLLRVSNVLMKRSIHIRFFYERNRDQLRRRRYYIQESTLNAPHSYIEIAHEPHGFFHYTEFD